jgi:hypothetical protein
MKRCWPSRLAKLSWPTAPGARLLKPSLAIVAWTSRATASSLAGVKGWPVSSSIMRSRSHRGRSAANQASKAGLRDLAAVVVRRKAALLELADIGAGGVGAEAQPLLGFRGRAGELPRRQVAAVLAERLAADIVELGGIADLFRERQRL